MKKIKNYVKLTKVNAEKLSTKEQCAVSGGMFCLCGCYYELCAGSSREETAVADSARGLTSIHPTFGEDFGYYL